MEVRFGVELVEEMVDVMWIDGEKNESMVRRDGKVVHEAVEDKKKLEKKDGGQRESQG